MKCIIFYVIVETGLKEKDEGTYIILYESLYWIFILWYWWTLSIEIENLTEEQKKLETLRDELSKSSVSDNNYN